MTTRVLVAHDAGARVFESTDYGKRLTPLGEIVFEDGRRQPHEIDADRSGRAGQGRHALEPSQDAKSHAVEGFAKILADDLSRAYHQGSFQRLVLIAPPRFLGLLRSALDSPLQKTLVGSVPKDLPRASASELHSYVEPFLGVGGAGPVS
jgi:protein required for attachment to host cells